MKKNVFITLAVVTFFLLHLFFMCNQMDNQGTDLNSEILNELDGSDAVKATPPVQPDIYIPAALNTFENKLETEITLPITVIVTETASPIDNYKLAYYWTGVSYDTGYLNSGSFYVNATETNVDVLIDSISMYYGGAGSLQGASHIDAVKFYMGLKGISNPLILDVLIYMSKFKLHSVIDEVTSGLWIVFQEIPDGGAPYQNVYMKAGSTVFSHAEGWYNNFTELP